MLKLPLRIMETYTLVLSCGSNLGNRLENLEKALDLVREYIGSVQQYSSVYESMAWGYKSTHPYYNQCLEVKTELTPGECMQKILEIEKILGRERRGSGYDDRVIDIDILFYDDLILDTGTLRIPHEKIQERKFVLVPLTEILPDFHHPESQKPVSKLLEQCSDSLDVQPLTSLLP